MQADHSLDIITNISVITKYCFWLFIHDVSMHNDEKYVQYTRFFGTGQRACIQPGEGMRGGRLLAAITAGLSQFVRTIDSVLDFVIGRPESLPCRDKSHGGKKRIIISICY